MLPESTNEWSHEEAAHLVKRSGFGGSPSRIAVVHEMGRDAALEAIFTGTEGVSLPPPEWTDEETGKVERRERVDFLRGLRRNEEGLDPAEIDRMRRQFNQKHGRRDRLRQAELASWWFGRMIHSPCPLREKMVLFWHDHFATSFRKVKQPQLLYSQNELFRQHAFGDARALTHAILRDRAMMAYLDTQNSKKGSPNENFAREVMELFTLGEGHYTEQDIREAARAFTGYQFNPLTDQVIHRRRRWDDGPKTIFGRTGNFDGDEVIDLLFEQPAAAEYIPSKLWAFFVEDTPPTAVVKELAKTFRESGFQVEAVLREIFRSRAFYDSSVRGNQIKSPIQFLAQMCQELELDGLPPAYFASSSQQLGQVLFQPPNVAGWDWGKAWINTNTLLSRYNIAGVVTTGSSNPKGMSGSGEADDMMMEAAENAGQGGAMLARIVKRSMSRWSGPDYESIAPRPLRENPEKLVDHLIERLFQSRVGSKERASFIEYARAKKGVIFTNHEVAELCHLMMSTPRYQLC